MVVEKKSSLVWFFSCCYIDKAEGALVANLLGKFELVAGIVLEEAFVSENSSGLE